MCLKPEWIKTLLHVNSSNLICKQQTRFFCSGTRLCSSSSVLRKQGAVSLADSAAASLTKA